MFTIIPKPRHTQHNLFTPYLQIYLFKRRKNPMLFISTLLFIITKPYSIEHILSRTYIYFTQNHLQTSILLPHRNAQWKITINSDRFHPFFMKNSLIMTFSTQYSSDHSKHILFLSWFSYFSNLSWKFQLTNKKRKLQMSSYTWWCFGRRPSRSSFYTS